MAPTTRREQVLKESAFLYVNLLLSQVGEISPLGAENHAARFRDPLPPKAPDNRPLPEVIPGVIADPATPAWAIDSLIGSIPNMTTVRHGDHVQFKNAELSSARICLLRSCTTCWVFL